MKLRHTAAAVLMLSLLVESTTGHVQEGRSKGKQEKSKDEKFHEKRNRTTEKLWNKLDHRGELRHENYRTKQTVDRTGHKHGSVRDRHGVGVNTYHIHTGHVTNQGQNLRQVQGHGSKSGYLSQVHKFDKGPGTGHALGHARGRLSRATREVSTKGPNATRPGRTSRTPNVTYTWTRNFGTGMTFDEAAFKSQDKNVVVVLSFDDTLKDSNLTASATLYDFTGVSGVMAIKPRRRPGPCFLLGTSLTYERIIDELGSRNGSSVSTSTVISIDGTGSPVSLSERQAILKKTPSLARQCRGRKIVRTRPKGFSPAPPEVQTKELKVLTMDAEMTITVPVDPDMDSGPAYQWVEGQRKNLGRSKSQRFWKGP